MTALRRRASKKAAKNILVGSYYERPLLALKPGQVRCPTCGRGSALTSTGKLRAHRDLSGRDCLQRLVGGKPVVLDEIPPVVIPPERSGNHLRATGRCHDCDRAVSGERRFCGQCAWKRDAS